MRGTARAMAIVVLMVLTTVAGGRSVHAGIFRPDDGAQYFDEATIGCSGASSQEYMVVTIEMVNSNNVIVDSGIQTTGVGMTWEIALEPNPKWPLGSYTLKMYEGNNPNPVDTAAIEIITAQADP